jgi:hypothetical protein
MKVKQTGPDWAALERDVVDRIRALVAIDQHVAGGQQEQIRRDLILPCVRLLAEFCAAVEIGEVDR